MIITFIIGILAGFAIACQSAMNARLRQHLQSPFLTSFVSFLVGFLFILLLALMWGDKVAWSGQLLMSVPFWAWWGGLLGMMSLSSIVLIFPKLGAVQTAVMPILGQVIAGVVIDSFGWFHAPKIAFSPIKMIGVVLVVVAVVLPNMHALKSTQDSKEFWLWRGIGVFGGVCMATQAAINGKLGEALQSPIHSAVMSFLVGTMGLFLVVTFYEKSWSNLKTPQKGKPWWMWLGGVLAGLFIYASIWLVPKIGTGSVVMLMLLGSILGSLFVDRFGWFGVDKKPIKAVQIIGIILMFIGVACVRLA